MIIMVNHIKMFDKITMIELMSDHEGHADHADHEGAVVEGELAPGGRGQDSRSCRRFFL